MTIVQWYLLHFALVLTFSGSLAIPPSSMLRSMNEDELEFRYKLYKMGTLGPGLLIGVLCSINAL